MPRPKGLPKTGGRQKGTVNKTTLLQQERRAIFDAKVSQMWENIIERLPATYIADQFLGRAPQSLDLTTQGDKIMTGEQPQTSYLASGIAELLRMTKVDGMKPEDALKRFREWHTNSLRNS